MSNKQIKWLILLIPTLTIGLWEYVRHEFFLTYISMELGNILSPIIVFVVTMLFVTQLFNRMERNQHELNEAKATQAVLLEREKIAAELHDGIAQSLFLLNVQIEQAERAHGEAHYEKLKINVHKTNAFVREAITSLRAPIHNSSYSYTESLKQFIDELRLDMNIEVEMRWKLDENLLPLKEKIDLLLSIREALLNVKKHSQATKVKIEAFPTAKGWYCSVQDNGLGLHEDLHASKQPFGLRIVRERAKHWSWDFDVLRKHDFTVFRIQKGLG